MDHGCWIGSRKSRDPTHKKNDGLQMMHGIMAHRLHEITKPKGTRCRKMNVLMDGWYQYSRNDSSGLGGGGFCMTWLYEIAKNMIVASSHYPLFSSF